MLPNDDVYLSEDSSQEPQKISKIVARTLKKVRRTIKKKPKRKGKITEKSSDSEYLPSNLEEEPSLQLQHRSSNLIEIPNRFKKKQLKRKMSMKEKLEEPEDPQEEEDSEKADGKDFLLFN